MASLLPKLNPEFSGVNPKTGEYLSPEERKQVFKLRKRKLDPSKVFDKSAIVKVDKPQANMDSVMKSIANIQETLQKISNFIITDAEEKKKETTKENRQLLLTGEKEDRKKSTNLLRLGFPGVLGPSGGRQPAGKKRKRVKREPTIRATM